MINIWNQVLDLFFPPYCIGCGKIGSFLCSDCMKEIIKIEAATCPACNQISENGKYCPRCRPKHSLAGILVFGYFKDEKLKEAIHAYKYQKLSAMSKELAQILAQMVTKSRLKFDYISWIPISRKRLAWRGFNQSELLARHLSKIFEKPTVELLKTRDTKTQVGLTKKQRLQNLSGAIKLKSNENLNGRTVLLIDDVVTTGTTLNECGQILKQNGARSVWGAVLAKE